MGHETREACEKTANLQLYHAIIYISVSIEREYSLLNGVICNNLEH